MRGWKIFFADLSGEGGHQRRIAGHPPLFWQEDAVPNVKVVGSDYAPVDQGHRAAVYSCERGSAHRTARLAPAGAVAAVAAAAAIAHEQDLAFGQLTYVTRCAI
jgi:hypothetical protein